MKDYFRFTLKYNVELWNQRQSYVTSYIPLIKPDTILENNDASDKTKYNSGKQWYQYLYWSQEHAISSD